MKKEKNNTKTEQELLSRRVFMQKCSQGAMALSAASTLTGCARAVKISYTSDMRCLDASPDRRSPNKSYIDVYDFDKCIECGDCLSGCVFRAYSEEESIQAIKNLRKGKNCSDYLDDCLFCLKCNHRCPEQAMPAALLLERMSEKTRKNGGVKPLVNYLTNGLQEKGYKENIFSDLAKSYTNKEKKIIAEWSEPKICDDLLFNGCGARVFPLPLAESKVLADLPIFGGQYDCCGIISSRLGQFEQGRYITNNLIDRLSKSSFKRLVVYCGSCQEQLTVMFPDYIGQEFPFQTISLYEWIDEQMQKGKFAVQREVEFDCAISDSCHGAEFGDDYLNTIRRLCTAIGMKIVELEHHGKNNACCGGAALLKEGEVRDWLKAAKVKEDDIKKSGKKHVVSYCGGCHIVSRLLHPVDSHYLMDNVMWALGDDRKEYHFRRRFLRGSLLLKALRYCPSMLI